MPLPTLLELDPRELKGDDANVRLSPDDPDLQGLAQTLRAVGVLQPLGVRRENGGYRVVFGNRRRAAAILAGLPTVPCLDLGPAPEGDLLLRQVLENVQRRDLNDLEKAEAFARLRQQLAAEGVPESDRDERVGQIVGLSPRTVRRYLRLRDLAPGARQLLAAGDLGVTAAQHLAAIAEPERQDELARLAVEQDLSAAQVARAAAFLARNRTLAPAAAVRAALRGEAPPDPVARAAERNSPAPAQAAQEPEADFWAEEPGEEEDEPAVGAAEPLTADGHRTFRIRSCDAFADEVARLARCLQEGDLAKAADADPAAPLKLRLATRQLGFVARGLDRLLRERGWQE